MKINYDKITDAVYIVLKEGKIYKTERINPRTIVDLDKKGEMIGIEILDYSSSNRQAINTLEENIKSGVPIQIISQTPKMA